MTPDTTGTPTILQTPTPTPTGTCTEGEGNNFELDQSAKVQERYVVQLGKILRDANPKREKYVKQSLDKAHSLQIRNWVISWTLPQKIVQCTNVPGCTDKSNVALLDEYSANAKALLDIAKDLLKKISVKKQGKPIVGPNVLKRAKSLAKRSEAQFAQSITLSEAYPKTSSECSK